MDRESDAFWLGYAMSALDGLASAAESFLKYGGDYDRERLEQRIVSAQLWLMERAEKEQAHGQ